LLSLLGWATTLGAGQSEQDAYRWLARMNQALAEQEYEGHYVSREGESLEAMRIRHTKRHGQDWEYLLSLNGTAREVIRGGGRISTIQPQGGRLAITQRVATQRREPLAPIDPDRLGGWYLLTLGGEERVAGRNGRVLFIQPKDDLRYGYRLVIDSMVGLPLDITLLRRDGAIVSELMFVELRVLTGGDEDAGAAASKPRAELETTEQQRNQARRILAELGLDPVRIGFVPELYQTRRIGRNDQAGEHLVLSDGLATISVYIEPVDDEQPFVGATQLGSISALGRNIEGRQLTLVGEVPMQTLEQLVGHLPAKSISAR